MERKSINPVVIILPILFIYALVQGAIAYSSLRPNVASVNQIQQTSAVLPDPVLSPTQIETFVNVERQKAGIPVLTHNDQLTNSACAKLDDMVAKNYWSHNDPSGQTKWGQYVDAAGYGTEVNGRIKIGENLAYGINSEKIVVSSWMESPGHRKNLLDSDFTEQGICTKYVNYQGGKFTLIVQHLGKR